MYRNFIRRELFNQQTALAKSFLDKVTNIPIFDNFNASGFHTCYLFDFSPTCERLIGFDLLTVSGTSIDFKTNSIKTSFTKVLLNLNYPKNQNNQENV